MTASAQERTTAAIRSLTTATPEPDEAPRLPAPPGLRAAPVRPHTAPVAPITAPVEAFPAGEPAVAPPRQPPSTSLPGTTIGEDRRSVTVLLGPEVAALLRDATPEREPRGRTIARALKIAASALVARHNTPVVDDDPWDEPAGIQRRQHPQHPQRLTFTFTTRQAEALRDLARQCEEQNLSRLVSDAIEYAYGPSTPAPK